MTFDLEEPLLYLSPRDPWTVRDSFEGTQVLGGIGSGKSSGSGQSLAKAMLSAGYGGLVLCAKPDEPGVWRRYAVETGRKESLIEFDASARWRFNFLDYESRLQSEAGTPLTKNLVDVLVGLAEALDLKETGGGGANDERYWVEQLAALLLNVIEIIQAATGGVTLEQVQDVVRSAPRTEQEVLTDEWQEHSACNRMMIDGIARRDVLPPTQARDFDDACRWVCQDWAGLAEKTRSIIQSKFLALVQHFLRGFMRDLFCTTTNVLPEVTFNGAVLVVALPVKQLNEAGRAAQLVWKAAWQRAIERRSGDPEARPAFLWVDESQLFLTREDQKFQTTARSSRAATVYLTQNIQNYHAVIGERNKAVVESLLGNLATKVFHAQSCTHTNQWAAELFNKEWQNRMSVNEGRNTMPGMPGYIPSGTQEGVSFQESLEYQVQPAEFNTLRTGGPNNGLEVDAIVYKAGRRWAHTGKTSLRVTFDQSL